MSEAQAFSAPSTELAPGFTRDELACMLSGLVQNALLFRTVASPLTEANAAAMTKVRVLLEASK